MFDTVKGEPGEYINHAVNRAISHAEKTKSTVMFHFNEISFPVNPDDNESYVVGNYNKIVAQRAERYRQSPEYKLEQERRKDEVAKKQEKVNELVESLDDAVKAGVDSALEWLYQLIPVADDVDVKTPKAYFAQKLSRLATRDCHSGTDVTKDPIKFKEWIIGQAIDQMSRSPKRMPPHPMLATFIERVRQ